jgi:hypothetical protein
MQELGHLALPFAVTQGLYWSTAILSKPASHAKSPQEGRPFLC